MRRAKISEKLNRRAGFSLAETLLVVIIITLLLALIVPNVISTRRSLAQRELDAKAELIYTAAQNQIVKLRAAGQRESYQLPESSDHSLPVPPCDREGDAQLYYFSSADRAGEDGTMKDIALLLMPDGVVEPELLGSHWVVEYDPLGDSVYAVFYSEELNIAYNYVHEWDVCNDLRVWDNRIETAEVGYYGGDVTATVSSAKTLQARLEVKNGEKLTAHLECSVPAALSDEVGTLTFRAELRQNGATPYVMEIGTGELSHEPFSRIYSYDLTLDDLSGADTRFDRLYGANSGHGESRMAPDKPVTLYLTVSSSNHLIKSSNTARSDPFSPLFDNDSSGARAVISCARHLQNLDGSSGVSLIRTAVQKDNIDFANTTAENDWYDCYGGTQSYFNGKDGANACFFPITNADLTDYDGGRWTIAGLNAASDGGAGLFGAVNDLRVHDLTLTGAKAGGADAGALAGRIGGAARIENCRVYLTGGDLDGARTKAIFWIDGTQAAGGLVGAVESGASLHITDSFAATGVVGNAAYACVGGLVGSASGTVEIASSYADCWVKGAQTGGLIGGGAATLTLTNCYASGFQTATSSAAGLANGAASMTNCYAACAMTGASTHATAASGSANNVWYLFNALGGGRNLGEHVTDKAALVTALGDRFRPTQSSTPYYLDGVALTPPYPYPCLTDANGSEIPHYGDWPASFQPGGLVYYEKYAGVSRGREVYGFYGADTVSSLRPDGDNVVGDGYGVVYEAGDENDGKELTACLDDGAPVSFGGASGTVFTVESGGVTYHVYPLPTEISAADLDAAAQNGHAGFYHKLEIAVKEGEDGMIYAFQPWLAKTAHYLGRTGESVTFPSVPDELCVRTPRHLRGMSLYYEHFAEDTRDRTFRQECDIDYNARERDSRHSAYDWKNFASCELHAAQQQEPIGASGFLAKYDAKYDGVCHTISHVSIVSKSERYVGLFGRNEGTLSNILLVTNFDKTKSKNYFVQRTDPISANNTAYIGLLTGYNEGKIENCAVAGYYVAGQHGDVNEEAQSGMLYGTLYAYQYSTLCAGGLAGGNSGTIRNSTADCPAIHISAHHATAKIGGFVGENTGAIEDCYALGHIEATYAEEGSVRIAGFAGFNEQGSIRESYCAVSLIASGSAAPYGFAPLGGYADACSYLDDGTYRYVGMLRAYKAERAKSAGTPSTIGELRAGQSAGYADSLHSAYHKNTNGSLPAAYPYRAVVKDGTGAFAHYGDWQDEIDMGDMGVFYWEHETGGSNNGYHFSYVGTKGENKVMSGTTLCTAHDDGGTISEYGYGYYHRLGETVSLSLGTDDGESAAGVAMSAADVCNEACARMLESQASGYRFYPYTTRTREEAEAAAAAAQSAGTAEDEIDQSYLYLSSTQHPDGKWTLTYDGTIVRNYRIAPFFANAMYLTLDGLADQSAVVTSEDGCTTDYRAAAGGEENPYEVRSARQLQYINWNYATQDTRQLAWGVEKSVRASGWDAFWGSVWDALRGIVGVDTLSEKGNFWQFTYLQYATPNQDKNYRQTSEDVFQYRPRQFWRQSHDVACDGFEGFTPIAGMSKSSSVNDNNALLYVWFGGDYDGQSYKIQNLAITSDSFGVGLFGVTAGANIKNIILYGNTGAAVIERDTTYREGDNKAVTGEAVGSYAIGGLIGIAMDYDETSAEQNAIENCAIAGYRIVDRSTNQHGIGGGNVGGLIGVSNVSLKRCSAVTNINIASKHNNGAAQWGNYIRAGGLVGAAKYNVIDCYAGGDISVNSDTVNEFYDNSGKPVTPQPGATYSRNKNVHIYVSGMSGSTYSSTFANFAMGDADSKTAALTNCYVYTRLPVLEGAIKGVSRIGSVADRYGQTCSLKMTNCYYLSETMENLRWENLENKNADDELETQTYFFSNPGGTGPEVSSGTPYHITQADWENMLDGNTAVNKKLISGDNKTPVITGKPIGLSYDQLSGKEPLRDGETVLGTMPALLNPTGSDKAWDWVTTVEGENAKIDGKYSFPGERDELLGKNYPFPTVVRQRDTSFGTQVNVHYGEWPNDGCYWKMGRDSMDIFADMQPSGWAEKTLTLYDTKGKLGDSPVFRVEPADAGIAELLSVDKDGNTYTVRVRALKTGAVSVVALDRADEAQVRVSCVIEVTANISITTTPEDLMLYHGQKQTLNAFAKARADALKDYTGQGTWSIKSAESGDAVGQSQYDITGGAPGSHVLTVEYTYDYHAGENGMKCREMLYVPYQTLGILGVGSAEGHSGVWRRLGNETSVDTEHGAPNCPQGADVYLYETASDKALDSLAVSGVTIAGEAASHSDGGDVDVYTAGNYTLTLDKTAKTDGAYACRAGTLLCRSAGAQDVAIRFTVTYGIDGEDPYELTTTLASVPTARIEFHANGGTGAMRSMGVGAAEKPLPACAFTREGCSFSGWNTQPDGSGVSYAAGAPISAAANVTDLYAQWQANRYTVLFDGNGGTGSISSLTMTYGGEAQLLPNDYTREGFTLVGWNTEMDGSGAFYALHQAVSDLTAEDGATVLLFAQWEGRYTLTLQSAYFGGGATRVFRPSPETARLSGYAAPVWQDAAASGTLNGWYSANDGTGVKVLNADGSIAAAVEHYTDGESGDYSFELDGDRTLYAGWSLDVYAPTDHLEAGETYAIVATRDGAAYLISENEKAAPTANGGRKDAKRSAITLQDGYLYPSGLSGEQKTMALWTASIDPVLGSGYFNLQNAKGNYLGQGSLRSMVYATLDDSQNDGRKNVVWLNSDAEQTIVTTQGRCIFINESNVIKVDSKPANREAAKPYAVTTITQFR